MENETYSIGLVDREVRGPLQVSDIESAGEVVRAAVRPADRWERHPIAAPRHGIELRAGGRDVVIVLDHGPGGVERQTPGQAVRRADRGAAGDIVVVEP